MVSIGISKILCGCSNHPALGFGALSLTGRVPNCQLGWSQFESGRARFSLLTIKYIEIYNN